MSDVPERYVEVLKGVCDLPTAPFCEEHVGRWLERWAERMGLKWWRDGVGNLYVEYVRGERREAPLVVEAHMDHPGFLMLGEKTEGPIRDVMRAEFRGGVKPSYFQNASVRFFVAADEERGARHEDAYVPRGKWVRGKVVGGPMEGSGRRVVEKWLKCEGPIPAGALGMWDLPDAEVHGEQFWARVCDDLAGCAAIVCMMEELSKLQVEGHVIGMFDRAEEVGFAGAIAAVENGWVPRGSRVIGLETSNPGPAPMAGEGPIVRVGDKVGLFSPGLTHFLTQCAGFIADEHSGFKYQRRLMDGGTCNTTAFVAWGYDAASICLALGNYHNMAESGFRWGGEEPPREKVIGGEWIHLGDFCGMVRILVEAVKRYDKYKPSFGEIRERFEKMHQEEQAGMLHGTAGRVKA